MEEFLKNRDEYVEDTSHYWSTPNTPSNSQKFGAANVAIQRAQRPDPTVKRIEQMIASQMFSWANKQEGAPIQVPYVGQQPVTALPTQPPPQPWQQAQPAIQPSFQQGGGSPLNQMADGAFNQGFAGQGPVSLITGRRIRLSDEYQGLISDSENARYDRMFAPWNPYQQAGNQPPLAWGVPPAGYVGQPPAPLAANGWPAMPQQPPQPQPWQGQGQGQAWPTPLPWQQQAPPSGFNSGQPSPLSGLPQAMPPLAQAQPYGQAWGQMQQGGPLLGQPNLGAMPMPPFQNWQGQPMPQQQAFVNPSLPSQAGVGWPGQPIAAPQQWQQAQVPLQNQQQMQQLGMDPNFPPWAQPQVAPSPQQQAQMQQPAFPQQAGLPSQQAQGYGVVPPPVPRPSQDWRVGTPPDTQAPFNSITPPWPSSVEVATLPNQGLQEPTMPSSRLYTEYANERTDVAQSAQALAAQRAMQRQNLTFEDIRSNSIIQSPLYADAITPADGAAPARVAPNTINPTQMVGSFALGEFFGSDLAYMPDVRGTTTLNVVPNPDAKPPEHPFKGLESAMSAPDQLDVFFDSTDSFITAMQDVDPLYQEEATPSPAAKPEASTLTYKEPAPLVVARAAPLPPPRMPKLDAPLFTAPKPVAVAPLDVDEKRTAAVMDERRQLAEKAVNRQPSESVDVATIYFHRSDNKLTEDDWHIINQVAKLHKQYQGTVTVYGYASTLAPDGLPRSYEDSLSVSSNQANAVAKALIEQGIDASQIRIKGFADMTPRVVTENPAKSATSSRVEISFAY